MISYIIKTSIIISVVQIFGDGAATYNLLIPDFHNSNGSFCPGTVALNCIGQKVPIILDWFINETVAARYLLEGTHEFPRNVSTIGTEFPVNVTIVYANGSITIDITSTLEGSFDYLNGATIQCGRGSELSEKIVVHGHEPSRIRAVDVNPFYNIDFELTSIALMWQTLESICPTLQYHYKIILKNDSGNVVNMMNVQCNTTNTKGNCMTDIQIPQPVSEHYVIEITPVNIDQGGISGPTYISTFINGSVPQTVRPDIDVIASKCPQSITCVSDIEGLCEIIVKDSSDMTPRISITGKTNTTLSVSHLNNNIQYRAVFNVNFVLYELEGNLSFTKGPDRDLDSHIYYITSRLLFVVIFAILSYGFTAACHAMKRKRNTESSFNRLYCTSYDTIFIILESISFIVVFAFWIATAILAALSSDYCSKVLLQRTEVLLKTSSVVTDVNTVVIVSCIILHQYLLNRECGSKSSIDINFKQHTLNEMTNMKTNEAYAVHRKQDNTSVNQTDVTYDYMN